MVLAEAALLAEPAAATNTVTLMETNTALPAKNITFTVVKADSEEKSGEDGKAANVLDGKADTIWHTQWQDNSPGYPHEIVIQLSEPATLKGFSYLPRQDDSENGMIKDYEIFTSTDGKEFGEPVAKGAFAVGKAKKTVSFEPKNCGYLKLRAISEANDEAWASAAEIGVVLQN